MTDLTPEARASCAHNHVWYTTSANHGMTTGWWECANCGVRFVPASSLVAEARIAVLQQVNQLACDGLSSSLSIKGMLAMHDRNVVAEARRAQREEDKIFIRRYLLFDSQRAV